MKVSISYLKKEDGQRNLFWSDPEIIKKFLQGEIEKYEVTSPYTKNQVPAIRVKSD
jgi:hypothetical protein